MSAWRELDEVLRALELTLIAHPPGHDFHCENRCPDCQRELIEAAQLAERARVLHAQGPRS